VNSVCHKGFWRNIVHVVSIRTSEWSESSAEHTVRFTSRTLSLTNNIEDIWGRIGLVRNRGRGVQPLDQAGGSVGIITQERAPGCGHPIIPVWEIRVEITRHEDGESSAQALTQLRLDYGSCGWKVGRHDFHCQH
jgi:hypothetical protein